MAETITESFCERCGTRYEFTAPTRLNPLRKTRGLFGGLKNYLTSQDALSDAIGDAMRDEEGALASAQLEAFHESFNFCIDCRQYTCVNCWNDGAGRCRTCSPVVGVDDLTDRVAASLAQTNGAVAEPLMANDDLQRRLGLEAWPVSDLPSPSANGHTHEPEAWPVAEPLAASTEAQASAPSEPIEGVRAADGFVYDTPRVELEEPQPEPMAAEQPLDVEPVAAQSAEPDWESVAAELAVEQAATEPLLVSAWDEDTAYQVEPEPIVAEAIPEPEPEPEPVVAEVAPEPEAEPVVADYAPEPEPVVAEAEPEPVVTEPEPVVAEVAPEPEPEPVVAEAAPEPEPEPVIRHTIAPISETILRFPQRPAAPDPAAEPLAAENDSPELAARRAQLDILGLGDPGEGPVPSGPRTVLPYRSRGATMPQGELAARAAAQGAQFWEASARQVASAVANVGIQNCGGCGLSLSANARFCRRCGSPQSRSA